MTWCQAGCSASLKSTIFSFDKKTSRHVLVQVAGGKNESVMEPKWTKNGDLVFISDRSGWWNLYMETSEGSVKALFPREAEFAEPAWMFGSRSYTILSDGRQFLSLAIHPQAPEILMSSI